MCVVPDIVCFTFVELLIVARRQGRCNRESLAFEKGRSWSGGTTEVGLAFQPRPAEPGALSHRRYPWSVTDAIGNPGRATSCAVVLLPSLPSSPLSVSRARRRPPSRFDRHRRMQVS